jgi:hypothetical protein
LLKNPRAGLVIDLPLIGDPKPTFREVVQIAKRINRDLGVTMLAKMNLLLGIAAIKEDLSGDADVRWKTQERLIADTVSERRLNQLKDKMRHAHLRDNMIFHRAQLMAAIKLVTLFGDPCRGNRLESRRDLDILTELALAINSLLNFGEIPDGPRATARHLAPQLAPSRELENLPRIDNALVRSNRMLGTLLEARRHEPLAPELERLFVFLTNGFSFDRFQNVMFGVFAYFQSLPVNDIGQFQGQAFMNPYAPGNVIMGPLFEQFLAHLSIDVGNVPGQMPAVKDERSLFYDMTFFRERPVWKYSSRHYLCVDPCFIVEKLASGFYWAVNQALAVDTSMETKKRTLAFSRLWGHLFEGYVHEVLAQAFPPVSHQLIKNPFFDGGGEEAFDAVVLEGANAVLFQIKGAFVKAEDKYSGRFLPFFRGVTEKFGDVPKGAIYQLATGVRSVFCLPRRRGLSEIPVRDIRTVWPVVVVLEPIMGFGLASKMLIERFERRAAGWIPQAYTSIRPPVFLEIEDLEVLVPQIQDGTFTLVDCLREKLGDDPGHIHSFHDFYWGQFVPEHKIQFKKNRAVEEDYAKLSARSLERFRDGTFTNYTSTPYGAVYPRAEIWKA